MFKGRHFYNKSIRNYIVLFGTLFNEMLVKRANQDEEFKVPLTYQMKEKFIEALQSRNAIGQDPNNPELQIVLPRMSFYMRQPIYNPKVKINKQQYSMNVVTDAEGNRVHQKQLAPVPYIFVFELGIYTRYEDDALQIIEQILPYFQPHFNAKIRENYVSGMVDRDVYINLVEVKPDEEVIGLMHDDRRIIQWNLTFELYGYVYPEIQDAQIIKRTIVNFVGDTKELLNDDAAIFRVTDTVDPFTAEKDEPHTIITTREYPNEG
jgi:hypothetical protein